MINECMSWLEQHRYLTNIAISVFSALFSSVIVNYFLYKRARIEINNEAEKIKYEMQRRYMQTEIQSRNLLEIYPKLYRLLRASGKIAIVFDVINKRLTELGKNKNQSSMQNVIKYQFNELLLDDPTFSLNDLSMFANYYYESLLFISDPINDDASQSKDLLMQLYNLAKNEIINEKYLGYDELRLIDLLNRANVIINKLNDFRDKIARQMNREFDPFREKNSQC